MFRFFSWYNMWNINISLLSPPLFPPDEGVTGGMVLLVEYLMVSFDLNFIYDINIDFSMVWVGIGLACYRINLIMDLISMILPSYLQHIGW